MTEGLKGAGISAAGDTKTESPSPRRVLSASDLVGVFDHLSDGVVVLDPDWRIQYANEPAGVMVGRPHPDLLGKVLWDEFPEAIDHPFHVACEDAVRQQRPQRLIERYEPLDSWFEARVFPQEEKLVVLFRDVTEEQLAADRLRDYVDRVAEAERIVGFGIWKWNVESGEVRWSDELHRIYGMHPGEFGGTVEAFLELVHPDDRERVWSHISECLETHEPFVFEERIVRPDGSVRTLLSKGRVIDGPDGGVQALIGVCHDVTDRARAEQALGASERRMHAIVDNTPSMITVKDLDGHCLMCNAETERILGIPASEIAGMPCSELLPPDAARVQRLADRRAAGEGEPVYGEVTLDRGGERRSYVTVTFPLPDEDGFPAETCTIATDVTERKERESERRRRIEWSERIDSALAEDRMLVLAQPIVNLRSGEIEATELLARMRGPGERAELLGPEVFMPAAERYALVPRIDVWVLGRALAIAADEDVQINISAVTMGDLEARAEIAAMLAAAPEAARRIVFEVTETADASQLEATSAFAAEITDLGARLALDDFGVGFGSFSYLSTLPLSQIKIDRSFVAGMTGSGYERRVVRTIVGIAREFGLTTVAEGIEDEETLSLARALGASHGQGYHLGRPVLVPR